MHGRTLETLLKWQRNVGNFCSRVIPSSFSYIKDQWQSVRPGEVGYVEPVINHMIFINVIIMSN